MDKNVVTRRSPVEGNGHVKRNDWKMENNVAGRRKRAWRIRIEAAKVLCHMVAEAERKAKRFTCL
jgi:hypothetical protein